MIPVDRHPLAPDASFDGGDLDCGNGLLLLIRQHMDAIDRGQLLEFRSTEISVEEDFPAWCRMTGNARSLGDRPILSRCGTGASGHSPSRTRYGCARHGKR